MTLLLKIENKKKINRRIVKCLMHVARIEEKDSFSAVIATILLRMINNKIRFTSLLRLILNLKSGIIYV